MASVELEYRNALENAPDEQTIHRFLKQYPMLVKKTFATSWNYVRVFSEVWLGGRYRLDFLVICADSCSWQVHVIELKSPKVSLYTKTGDKTDLRLVKKQLVERNQWIEENTSYYRTELSKLVSDNDPGAQCSNVADHQNAGAELRDTQTLVRTRFHAVIGRASSLSANEQKRRRAEARTQKWGAPQIVTYDRFLAAAKEIDGYRENKNSALAD